MEKGSLFGHEKNIWNFAILQTVFTKCKLSEADFCKHKNDVIVRVPSFYP